MSVGTGLIDGVIERQINVAEPGPLAVSIESSPTGEVPKAADRFAVESRHRRSNGSSVTLTRPSNPVRWPGLAGHLR
jgi:hypothetical protein